MTSNGKVNVFEVNPSTGRFVNKVSKHYIIGNDDGDSSLIVNLSGSKFAVLGCQNRTIYVCSTASGEINKMWKATSTEGGLLISGIWIDDKTLAAGYSDGCLKLFQTSSEEPVNEMFPFRGGWKSMGSTQSLSKSKEKKLSIGPQNSNLGPAGSIWALGSGETDREEIFCGNETGTVVKLQGKGLVFKWEKKCLSNNIYAIARRNNLLAVGGYNGKVLLLNSVNGDLLVTANRTLGGKIQSIHWSPKGDNLAVLSTNETALLMVDVIREKSADIRVTQLGSLETQKQDGLFASLAPNWFSDYLIVGTTHGQVYKVKLKI